MCAQGGNLMRGYWNDPGATAEAFRGGWYHTGDEGRLDDEGYLYLVDRVKDMIVTGGENVYSIEVENALSTHPAVDQVAVIGIPDEHVGRGGARHRRAPRRGVGDRRGAPRTGPASASPATRCRSRSSSAPIRSPSRGRSSRSSEMLRAPYWAGHERQVQ